MRLISVALLATVYLDIRIFIPPPVRLPRHSPCHYKLDNDVILWLSQGEEGLITVVKVRGAGKLTPSSLVSPYAS